MKYLSQSACSTASNFLFISIWLSAVFLSFGDDYQYDREQYDGDDGDEFGGHLDTEADEKELKALVKAKADPLVIKRKRNAIAQKRTAARKKASLDKARGRVALLKIRVEALEEELRALVAA